MRSATRRDFLHEAMMAASTGLFASSARSAPTSAETPRGPAAERLRVAVLGVNGRGMAHIRSFAGRHNCVVAAICDPDCGVVDRALRSAAAAQDVIPRYEPDLRRVLDDRSIDIVTIATPNHWHALAAIWALQAGKHVYVEKPVSHNVLEGRRMVEAARKYRRICQAGMQSRSNPGMREAMAFLHAGKLGKIRLARGLCYKRRPGIGKVEGAGVLPKTVDYDLWCGPAPKKPLARQSLHYDWHWQWDFGNGDLGNQGIHEMDKARWGLGKDTLPRSVLSVGGRFGPADDGETANTQLCVYDYGDCTLLFEVRGLPTKPLLGASVGNIFHGSEGYMVCPSYDRAAAFTPRGELIRKFEGSGDHAGNFIAAVRANRPELLHADIAEGHLSSALCHIGNISYRLGTEVGFDEKKKQFADTDAAEAFTRMETHVRAFKLPAAALKYRCGRRLRIDAKTESFFGDHHPHKLLTRVERQPFVVPEQV
jgi:predicted dehydrogenase